MALSQNFLETTGLTVNGDITNEGWQVFSMLLDYVGPYPNLTPGLPVSPHDIFLKFLSKVVPATQELIIIQGGKVLLTRREDKFFQGWHTPGSYIGPRETLIQTTQRIIDREIPGIKILSAEIIGGVSNYGSRRFHDFSALVAVNIDRDIPETDKVRWFSEEPQDMINVHRPFWPIIEKFLK